MLAATGQLDLPAMVFYGGALIAGWLIDSERVRWKLPKLLVNWLMILYVPFAFIDWRVLGTMPVLVVVHFIFFASALKLLHPKASRDWLWLYIVAFFEMLLAAGMTIDTTFFLLLLLFLFAAISTLTSFEIRRAQNDAGVSTAEVEIWKETPQARRRLGEPRWRQLGWFSALSLGLILMMAAPLFLAMPRLSHGLMGGGLMSGATMTGFSDNVRLGDVAQLKLNPQVVMRVQVEQPPEQFHLPLRWRGVTLDEYDGRGWNDSMQHDRRPVPQTGDGFRLDTARDQRFITRQKFYLAPLDIGTIFAAPRPLLVQAPGISRLSRDRSDGLWMLPHRTGYLSYTVLSDTSEYHDPELRADNSRLYPLEVRDRYLQLPKETDPRIGELARQITRGAETQQDAARRIESHLRTAFRYTLDLKRTNNGEPLADFLFNVKAGHCEYFATAMAVMLRTLNIPTRLVNGFQTGEYSEVVEMYTVRQSDAHSWVEVYYPEHGWVAFDPTPAAGLSKYESGMLSVLRHYGEAMELFWLERVIGFDAQEQLSIALKTQRWLSSQQNGAASRWFDWKEKIADWLKSWRESRASATKNGAPDGSLTELLRNLALHPLALAFYGLIGLAGAMFGWRQYARSWRRRSKYDAAGSAVAFYQEMLDTLERAGYRRKPDQTPLEFAQALALPHVSEITRVYQQVRFGGGQLTKDEIDLVGHLLRDLKKQKPQPDITPA